MSSKPRAGGAKEEPGVKHSGRPPLRTCLGCRGREHKEKLMRVAIVDERLVLDRHGSLPGRGGYLHWDEACAREFAKRGGFVTSFRRVLGKQQRANLIEQVRGHLANGWSGQGVQRGSK